MALTEKQQRFVELYAGNGVEAARGAGYAGDAQTLAQVAHENLRKPEVQAALSARRQGPSAKAIANREARQAFWTRLMEDEELDVHARLKASELLGKSEADFTQRHTHDVDVRIAVVDPYAQPPAELARKDEDAGEGEGAAGE